ncbi:MAG: alcohol dehydrogenase catalytic domain-containing protein [Eubacteriales bacterium]|nr:alcohol dehydrogenase catalytic domain-containing protein [Eubacteriales bacterium]
MENKMGRIFEKEKVDFLWQEVPEPGEKEVLLKIEASLICGSDLHIFRDRHPSVQLPVTVGHEFSGTVLKTGSGVKKFREGDRVVVEPAIPCGQCAACKRGNYGYCENLTFTYRCGHGAMAPYFVGAEDRMYHLPDEVSFEKGALAEPLAVAVHAVKRADIRMGDCVAITGAGAIGIMIASICRKLGAREVVISDFSPERLKMAKELGATRTVLASEENLEEVVAGLSHGAGFEKAFECVGLEATFRQLLNCMKVNGLVTDVGIFEKPLIQMDVSCLVKKELRIQGAQGYCWDFEDALQLLTELPYEKLITHHFPLEDLQTALETAGNPKSGAIKVCITPQGAEGGTYGRI